MVARGLSPLARGTVSVTQSCFIPQRFIPARAGNRGARGDYCWRSAVYPRSRGEQHHPQEAQVWERGLSPLARGTGQAHFQSGYGSRFIPARAGNSATSSVTASLLSVYPRSRGEQGRLRSVHQIRGGLSPLARGTVTLIGISLPQSRFIPARAGNRSYSTVFTP